MPIPTSKLLPNPQTNRRPFWRLLLGGLSLVALWSVLAPAVPTPVSLTAAQQMAILTTHCPALRQQPDVLGCLPDPAGIRLITDRPALMPPTVAGLPVLTEPPPPHLPPPPGVIVLRVSGPDPQPTWDTCPPGYREVQQYRWRTGIPGVDPPAPGRMDAVYAGGLCAHV